VSVTLREFVYLDEVSVNSHLASLGKGRPKEIVQQTQSEKEVGGGVDLKVARGDRVKVSGDSTETTRDATSPYLFEDLLTTLDERDIDVHDNPDPRSVKRGDVIRVTGTAIPMSLYKLEIAMNAFIELLDDGTIDTIEDLDDMSGADNEKRDHAKMRRDEQEENDPQQALKSLKSFKEVAEQFTGNRIPIRFSSPDFSYATTLDRSHMTVDQMAAFFEQTEYTVFGRVKDRVERNDSWDPISATNTMGTYFADSEMPEGFRSDMREGAESISIKMEDEDMLVEGRAAIIHPFAVYW